MARWEIQRLEHPSVYVETDDTRDLAAEWVAFQGKVKRRAKDRLWTPTPGCALDGRIVVGVVKVGMKKRKSLTKPVGFHA